MKLGRWIFIILFITAGFLFFCYTVYSQDAMDGKPEAGISAVPAISTPAYYMQLRDSQVVIYNKDHSIYEFTDIEEEFLPASLLYDLQNGIYFEDQQELYEFLETYTS